MKFNIYGLSIMCSLFFFSCTENISVNYDGVESAGKFMPPNGEENELNGAAYVLASDDYMDKALNLTEAYSNLDSDKMKELFVEGDQLNYLLEEFENLESYSWKPWAMIPLRNIGDDGSFVISFSNDEEVQKNGTKLRANYIDVIRFDDADEGKVSWIWGTNRDNQENECCLKEGGKFIGRNPENDWNGRPFVFSNRGEIEILETFIEAANELDAEAVSLLFTNPFLFNGEEITHDQLAEIFSNRESQEWKPWAMLPIKIKDTDPASGVLVYSTAKVVGKNGNTWEADLSEQYFFDLEGKIESVNQYVRELPKQDESSEE